GGALAAVSSGALSAVSSGALSAVSSGALPAQTGAAAYPAGAHPHAASAGTFPSAGVPLAPTIDSSHLANAANQPQQPFASTSAPVFNTMPEGVPRRGPIGLILGGVGVAMLIAAGVVLYVR